MTEEKMKRKKKERRWSIVGFRHRPTEEDYIDHLETSIECFKDEIEKMKLECIACESQGEEITELEASIKSLNSELYKKIKKKNDYRDLMSSVADELEEKIKTKNVGLPINPMIYAIHIKPSIERLRGKVPEQYNYDTPAKPATDHEEVAPDPDIQKLRG